MGRMEPGAELTTDAIRETSIGQTIHDLASRLFPICRSITGKGVATRSISLKTISISSSTPFRAGRGFSTGRCRPEWVVRDAYVKNAADAR